jgi:hypothetical protein
LEHANPPHIAHPPTLSAPGVELLEDLLFRKVFLRKEHGGCGGEVVVEQAEQRLIPRVSASNTRKHKQNDRCACDLSSL